MLKHFSTPGLGKKLTRGLAFIGALVGASSSYASVSYERAKTDDTILSYTSFILSAALTNPEQRDEVELAFCRLLELDAEAAQSVASQLVGSPLAGNFVVSGVGLQECATNGFANLYVI